MDENAPAWVQPRPPPDAICVVDTKNTKRGSDGTSREAH
jgi:hypothetical protein